jgi:hypothetical protein
MAPHRTWGITIVMGLDRHCASFDFARDEADRFCQMQFILILSEVAIRDAVLRRLLMMRGRRIDVQCEACRRLTARR